MCCLLCLQAFTSAATGVISALATKPNVQLPDLSGLFSKPSFNMTLPTISMPSLSVKNMPDMVRAIRITVRNQICSCAVHSHRFVSGQCRACVVPLLSEYAPLSGHF
jgi:hypothetical protein